MASDQHQLNMSATELSDPGNMEGSAEMASTLFSASRMTDISMPNHSDLSQNNQLNDQRSPRWEDMDFSFLQPNQSPFQQGHQGGLNEMNSQQCLSGGTRHYEQPQFTNKAQCQTAQLNLLHSASGGMMHPLQTSQPYQSQNQLNSLQPTSGGVRNSQQFQETGQSQLTQGETSHDSPQTKSSSAIYRLKQKTLLDAALYLLSKSPLLAQATNQQIQPLSFSAPDHYGTNSGHVDEYAIYVVVAEIQRRNRKLTTSRQRNEPHQSKFSAQRPTADGFQIMDHHEKEPAAPLNLYINGSQMSNDVQDPHRMISSSSVHPAESQENSQAKSTSTPAVELSKKIIENDMNINIATKSSASNRGGRTSSSRGDRRGLESSQPSPSDDINVVDPELGLIHCPQTFTSALPESGSRFLPWRSSEIVSGILASQGNAFRAEVEKENFPVNTNLNSDVANAAEDYHETETGALDQFNGLQMSNDNQDPQRWVSSSSGGVGSSAQSTTNRENSQAGTMPMAELPKKSSTNSMSIVTKDSLLVELMRLNSDPPPIVVDSTQVTPQAKRKRVTISDCPTPRSSGASLRDKSCSKNDKGKEVGDGSVPSLLDSQGRLARYGRWKESVNSTEKVVTAIDLTLQLGLEDSGFEDGRVAYTLTKAMILPKDTEKFQTLQGDVSIAGQALVHEQYRTMMMTLAVAEKCDQLNYENSHLLANNHSLTSQVDGFKRKLVETLATCSDLSQRLDALKKEKEESDGLVKELRMKVSFLESTMEDAKQVAITEYKASEAFTSDVSAASLGAMRVGFDFLFDRVRLDYPDINFPKYTLLQVVQDAEKHPDT